MLSVGLEGKTVGRGGFKCHTDIHVQSESDCEIQQDGGRRVKDDLRVKWTQTEDGSCLSAHIASGRAVNSITPLLDLVLMRWTKKATTSFLPTALAT